MSIGLKIDLHRIEDKVVLRLDGRLDAATSSNLEKKLSSLLKEGHIHLLLDFSKVDYLSSAGLRLLLSMMKRVAKEKGSFILFSIGEDVMEIIKLAGFEKILKITSSEQQALQMRT